MASKPTGKPNGRPTKRELKKVGRPRIELDPSKVEALAALQCTQDEIAIWYGVVRQTISMINIGMSWGWLKEEVGNV